MTLKKVVVGTALFLALGLAAFAGVRGPVPAAHAEGCDNFPPPPGLTCPTTPTPTPTRPPGS